MEELDRLLERVRSRDTKYGFCETVIDILHGYDITRIIKCSSFLIDDDRILITKHILREIKSRVKGKCAFQYMYNKIKILYSLFVTFRGEYEDECWINTFILCLYCVKYQYSENLNIFFYRSSESKIEKLLNLIDNNFLYRRFYHIADYKVVNILCDENKELYVRTYDTAMEHIIN